jgi:hypothetical protein
MGSPHTKINPWRIFSRFPSPQKAERHILKIKNRADIILKPYGISVSWEAIAQSMTRKKVVGKAAIWAANKTLEKWIGFYEEYAEKEKGRFFYLKAARGLVEMEEEQLNVKRWAVNQVLKGNFESIREALGESGRLYEDSTDGVLLLIDPETRREVHGIEILTGWKNDFRRKGCSNYGDNNSTSLFRQTGTGRIYHMDWVMENDRHAVRVAIKQWRTDQKH